jgi:bacteriochlorophyll 4-vinyl reductase
MTAVRADAAAPEPRGEVWAYLPLSLLLAVRAHDRPGEILEDEDLTLSLPRRLGLSGVIEREIQHYERAEKRGRRVEAVDVVNLIRLVLRRPDAEAILRDTGERVAEEYLRRVPGGWRRLARALPTGPSLALGRRAARRLLRRLIGEGRVEITGHPAGVRVKSALTRGDATGTACGLFAAAVVTVIRAYAGERASLHHANCASTGAAWCEWTIAEA